MPSLAVPQMGFQEEGALLPLLVPSAFLAWRFLPGVGPGAIEEPPKATSPTPVSGRFLPPDGSPVAAVTVSLFDLEANPERVLEFGLPESYEAPVEVLTGEDGRLRIELDPPLATQFALNASLAGYGTVSWRWNGIEPGRPLETGATTLVPSSDVLVRLVDAEGKALPSTGWRVFGESPDRKLPNGRDETRADAIGPEPDVAFVWWDCFPVRWNSRRTRRGPVGSTGLCRNSSRGRCSRPRFGTRVRQRGATVGADRRTDRGS